MRAHGGHGDCTACTLYFFQTFTVFQHFKWSFKILQLYGVNMKASHHISKSGTFKRIGTQALCFIPVLQKFYFWLKIYLPLCNTIFSKNHQYSNILSCRSLYYCFKQILYLRKPCSTVGLLTAKQGYKDEGLQNRKFFNPQNKSF